MYFRINGRTDDTIIPTKLLSWRTYLSLARSRRSRDATVPNWRNCESTQSHKPSRFRAEHDGNDHKIRECSYNKDWKLNIYGLLSATESSRGQSTKMSRPKGQNTSVLFKSKFYRSALVMCPAMSCTFGLLGSDQTNIEVFIVYCGRDQIYSIVPSL